MSTTTAAGTHAFTASTEDRRRCTCGKSRNTAAHGYDAKARAAGKATPFTAEENAALAAMEAAELAAEQATVDAAEAAREAAYTAEVTATDVRAATDASWTAALTAPPAEKAPVKRKPETERMTSLWVARNMVEGLTARATDTDPAVASIAGKVDASTPNARGGRTIRLTEAELRALSGIATEVENAATEAGDGTVAMSARKLHARLDGYLSTY